MIQPSIYDLLDSGPISDVPCRLTERDRREIEAELEALFAAMDAGDPEALKLAMALFLFLEDEL